MTTHITIYDVVHESHRYPTAGDWQWLGAERDRLAVYVSDMADWKHEFLVAIHELIEAAACRAAGIATEEVDAFDALFERERAAGAHQDGEEPGDDERAPYRNAHVRATLVEKMVADILCVDWATYEKAIEELDHE